MLTAGIATFSIPTLKETVLLLGSCEDRQYDLDHLQLEMGGSLENLPYVITELPQTQALLMDGEINATAVLLLVKAISSDKKWCSMTLTEDEDGDEGEGEGEGENPTVYYALKGLPTLLERATGSFDLLSALPSRSTIIYKEHAAHFPDEWNAVRVAIKSYLERNGFSVSAFYITDSGPSWRSDIGEQRLFLIILFACWFTES